MTDLEKRREMAQEIVEIVKTAIKGAIREGAKVDKDVVWRITPGEYGDGILSMWLEDEDGKIAIDRLVSLII